MADADVILLIQIFNAICCLIGFVLFVMAWNFARKISLMLKDTRIVKRWNIAAAMVGFFSLGYLGNILIVFVADLSVLLIVEALVFLVGAIFVLLVFNLSFKTYELIYEIP
jgi:hypothetical protein